MLRHWTHTTVCERSLLISVLACFEGTGRARACNARHHAELGALDAVEHCHVVLRKLWHSVRASRHTGGRRAHLGVRSHATAAGAMATLAHPSTARRSSWNADRTVSRAAFTTDTGASGEKRVDHSTIVLSTSPWRRVQAHRRCRYTAAARMDASMQQASPLSRLPQSTSRGTTARGRSET